VEPLRQKGRDFLDILLRRKYRPRLIPIQHLQRLTKDGSRWEVVGNNPEFELAGGLPGGWVKMTIVASASKRTPISISVDRGKGYTPAATYQVGVADPAAAIFQVIIPLGQNFLGVRLNPADSPCLVDIPTVIACRILYLEMVVRSTLVWLKQVDYRPREIRYALKRLIIVIQKAGILGALRTITNRFTPFSNSYEQWLQQHRLTLLELNKMSTDLLTWDHRPKISILMPVYNTREDYLREALDSVCAQVYPEWELCIADDASTLPSVREVIEEYQQKDSRIKVVWRSENGHISAATNSALELAEGEFVACLDHDDLLAPNALYEVAKVLVEHPDIDMIYSDEDRLAENGTRYFPHFKPDWSPDLFLGTMYTTHLAVYRKSILLNLGGFRKGFEGAQDWDLVLRLTEKTSRIYHLPQVLYSWRCGEGSTAHLSSNKSYAYTAAQRAITEALNNKGIHARVKEVDGFPGFFRIQRFLTGNPKISIIICSRDKANYSERCVKSIFEKTKYQNFEVLLIDNNSRNQETFRMYERWLALEPDRFRVHKLDIPFNFSLLNNQGVELASGDIVLLLNNDTEVITPEWLEWMAVEAQREEIAAVGAVLLYPNNTIQHAGIVLGISGWAGHVHRGFPAESPGYQGRLLVPSNYSAVTGACMMMRKELYQKLGGLDPHLAVAGGDVEICLRANQQGLRNLLLPDVRLYHYESITRGYEDNSEKRARFVREIRYVHQRWPDQMARDPYYNPNLSVEREDYSVSLE